MLPNVALGQVFDTLGDRKAHVSSILSTQPYAAVEVATQPQKPDIPSPTAAGTTLPLPFEEPKRPETTDSQHGQETEEPPAIVSSTPGPETPEEDAVGTSAGPQSEQGVSPAYATDTALSASTARADIRAEQGNTPVPEASGPTVDPAPVPGTAAPVSADSSNVEISGFTAPELVVDSAHEVTIALSIGEDYVTVTLEAAVSAGLAELRSDSEPGAEPSATADAHASSPANHDSLREQNDKLIAELAVLKAAHSELDMKNKELEAINETIKLDLASNTPDAQITVREVNAIKAENQDLRAAAASLVTEVSQKEAEMQALRVAAADEARRARAEEAEVAAGRLQKAEAALERERAHTSGHARALDEERRHNAVLRRQLSQHEEARTIASANEQGTRAELSRLREAQAALMEEKEAAGEVVAGLQARVGELEAAGAAGAEQAVQLRGACAALEGRLHTASSEKTAAMSVVEKLLAENEELVLRLNGKAQQLEEERGITARLRAELAAANASAAALAQRRLEEEPRRAAAAAPGPRSAAPRALGQAVVSAALQVVPPADPAAEPTVAVRLTVSAPRTLAINTTTGEGQQGAGEEGPTTPKEGEHLLRSKSNPCTPAEKLAHGRMYVDEEEAAGELVHHGRQSLDAQHLPGDPNLGQRTGSMDAAKMGGRSKRKKWVGIWGYITGEDRASPRSRAGSIA